MLNKVKKYIHYGSSEFRPVLFTEIRNRYMFNKPDGGLWASPIDSTYGWKDWCFSNEYKIESLDKSFTFLLKPDTKVFKVNTLQDLKNMQNDDLLVMPSHNAFLWDLRRSVCYPNFEKIQSLGYDAFEFVFCPDLYFPMYGWDCDSIVIFNPDCMIL